MLLCTSVFEAELADVIPVVKTSIGGTRIIGRLCAGKVFLILIYSLGFSRSNSPYHSCDGSILYI